MEIKRDYEENERNRNEKFRELGKIIVLHFRFIGSNIIVSRTQ